MMKISNVASRYPGVIGELYLKLTTKTLER